MSKIIVAFEKFASFSENYGHYFLALTFLSLGFNKLFFYLPAILLFLLVEIPNLKKIKVQANQLILPTLFLIFLISLFAFQQTSLESPFNVFIKFCAILLLGLYSALRFNASKYYLFFVAYLIGVVIDQLIFVGYSFYTDRYKYGYGLLLDPYLGREFNSPGVANLLALSFSIFFPLSMAKKYNRIIFLLFSLFIILIAVSGLFLQSRTFVIIMFLTLGISPFVFFKLWGGIKRYLFLCLISMTTFFLFIYKTDLMERFDSSGITKIYEDTRFNLIKDGLEKVPRYPFGGFSPERENFNGPWFHNIFLDTARMSGWIGLSLVTLFFVVGFFQIYQGYHSSNRYFMIYFWSLIISFLLMLQDVVVEGIFQLLALYLIALLFLIHSNRAIKDYT